MFAAYGRHTQAGIDRRRAEQRLARVKQDNVPERVLRLLQPPVVEPEPTHEERRDAFAERSRANRAANGDFRHTLKGIQDRICNALNCSRADLLSSRRTADLVNARQAVMYWTCRLTQMSYLEIGRRMGGLDHATVRYGTHQYPAKRAEMGRYVRAVR